MKAKGLLVIIGAAALSIGGLVVYRRSVKAETTIYECAFCSERFDTADAVEKAVVHMQEHIQQKWGQTGAPGWILEDVNRDGIINVMDMIKIGQHQWTIEPIDDNVYKIVF